MANERAIKLWLVLARRDADRERKTIDWIGFVCVRVDGTGRNEEMRNR